MDEERNPPFFPLRTQTRSACQPPALLSGLPASPPRSRTIGQTDGRTDGRTDSAGPARPGAGARAGRAGGDVGVNAGCPLPTARPRPGGGCLGILFFSSSLPVRSLAAGAAPAPRTPMGVGEALTPTRLWQRRQRGSETPPPPGKCRLCSPPVPAPSRVCWVLHARWVPWPTCTPPLGAPRPFWALSSCPGCCPSKHQTGDPVGSSVWGWLWGAGPHPGCAKG